MKINKTNRNQYAYSQACDALSRYFLMGINEPASIFRGRINSSDDVLPSVR